MLSGHFTLIKCLKAGSEVVLLLTRFWFSCKISCSCCYKIIFYLYFQIEFYVYIIDEARGQDGWILAEFSFCVFMDRDEVEVHKNVKRERGQYPTILTELAWSIKDLLYGIKSTEKK